MTKKEFYEKHGLHFKDIVEEMMFIGGLDKLYLEFTKDQAIAIIADYCDCADDIYNEIQDEVKEALNDLFDAIKKAQEEKEEEELLDKKCEA